MSGKDPDTLQKDQLDRKKILEEFPVMEQDLEKDTEKLHVFETKLTRYTRTAGFPRW